MWTVYLVFGIWIKKWKRMWLRVMNSKNDRIYSLCVGRDYYSVGTSRARCSFKYSFLNHWRFLMAVKQEIKCSKTKREKQEIWSIPIYLYIPSGLGLLMVTPPPWKVRSLIPLFVYSWESNFTRRKNWNRTPDLPKKEGDLYQYVQPEGT